MAQEYVEQRQGGYYLTGTRVSLDSIYLAHRDQIDEYLRTEKADFDQLRDESRRAHPLLYSKLEAARQAL